MADTSSTPAAALIENPPADDKIPGSLESPAAVEPVDDAPVVVMEPPGTAKEAPTAEDPQTTELEAVQGTPTRNEKLLDAMHQLVEHSDKQSDRMNTALERLNIVVESLKPQTQSSDKKTAFWTAYKTLADEFDKEFQRKYGDDLDTSLIFAGLFSAVSSAFIIQIQPELQLDPNAATQTLLLALVQNITGTTPAGPQITEGTGPAPIIVVAQSLLYFSLMSTLLAALLAVLGKQWLLHYDSVGERGTLEERGLERQRKFTGLKNWKFDLVMQIFPLLLQLGLLLFASALSIYLWTINHVIAGLVLGLTSLGVVLYTLMVISAVASPDSPFQTSLTFLLNSLIKRISDLTLMKKWGHKTWKLIHTAGSQLSYLFSPMWLACSALMKTLPPLLPQFNTENPSDQLSSSSGPVPIFGDLPKPSEAVAAVIWALETTTDPRLVEPAAGMVPELQWPLTLDVKPSVERLSDILRGCFNGSSVQDGMSDRATNCIQALCIFQILFEPDMDIEGLFPFPPFAFETSDADLTSAVRAVAMCQRYIISNIPHVTQWALRFGLGTFGDYNLSAVLKGFQPMKPHSPITPSLQTSCFI
ncbi:hypothetical protein DFH09DRAFT_509000 [Mycena vulgaris]|nr:hypothetical protein DFH09DRAFT_509000 [Mycena vulgaris]